MSNARATAPWVAQQVSCALLACALLHCSNEQKAGPPTHQPPVPVVDAGEHADAGSCKPSASASDWQPHDIPPQTFEPSGIKCEHPAVHAQCSNGWCQVPAGCFVLGSREDEWRRGAYNEQEVAAMLTRSFAIQQHETTRAEWLAVGFDVRGGKSEGRDYSGDCEEPTCPVASVSWFDAASYANKLSQRDGLAECYKLTGCEGVPGTSLRCSGVSGGSDSLYRCTGYRLPTRLEWEYSVRAGTRSAFYSGDITSQGYDSSTCCVENSLDTIGWYCANSGFWTHPVGAKAPNGWGLYDMTGNAWEWINDPFEGALPAGPLIDYGATLTKKDRALLVGGSAHAPASLARSSSTVLDTERNVRVQGRNMGFRLVRSMAPDAAP